MNAKSLDELLIYQKALVGAKAVSALLNRPGFRYDHKLRGQLSDASDSTCSNISEGFGQQSDRKFAQFLYYAKGSAYEVRTRLFLALQKGHITEQQRAGADATFEEVAKMATRFIQYLERCDRPLRGLAGPPPGDTDTAETDVATHEEWSDDAPTDDSRPKTDD